MWQFYLEQFGKPMPVDVWNMHVYVLPEAELDGTPNGIANVALGTDPALAKRGPGTDSSMCAADEIYCYAEHDSRPLFRDQVRAMRRWMLDHGQRQKPLILTEFSIILPCRYPELADSTGSCDFWDEFGNDFDEQRVQEWLETTTTYLENAISDLVTMGNDQLTPLGQQYQLLANNMPIHANLSAVIDPVTADTTTEGGTVDVTLWASVANNGSVPVDSAFEVTFYADSGLTQVIGQQEVPAPGPSSPGLADCALRTVPVSVTWPSLSAGLHPFWVELDSQNNIDEGTPPEYAGENDNVISSFVLVNPQRVSLPRIGR
jgi:hypothetical protein